MTKIYSLFFRSAARSDLLAIRKNIMVATGPTTAEGFVKNIADFCTGLGVFPRRGVSRAGFKPDLYLAFYRRQATIAYLIEEERNRIIILRVFEAGRDFERALGIKREKE